MPKPKIDSDDPPRLQRLISKRELPQFMRLGRSSLYKLICAGEFPQPVSIYSNSRIRAWLEDELIRWQQERIAARNSPEAIKAASAAAQHARAARAKSSGRGPRRVRAA